MVDNNEDPKMTAFAITVDAKLDVSTGISAGDRARTLRALADLKVIQCTGNTLFRLDTMIVVFVHMLQMSFTQARFSMERACSGSFSFSCSLFLHLEGEKPWFGQICSSYECAALFRRPGLSPPLPSCFVKMVPLFFCSTGISLGCLLRAS